MNIDGAEIAEVINIKNDIQEEKRIFFHHQTKRFSQYFEE